MKKVVLLFCAVSLCHPLLAQTDELTSQVSLVSVWIEEKMAYEGIPGLAVGVVSDGALVWQQGFGYADAAQKIPMTPQTLSRIASITKTFTATAILKLQEMGRLKLDDPVVQYLPWFQPQNEFSGEPPITIRNLLTHTSGLPREAAFPYWTDHLFPTREQLITALPGQSLINPPVVRHAYSNLGLAVAGEVVAAAAGEPYERFIEKNIFAPLQMKRSFVILPAEQRKHLAASYDYRQPDGTRNRLDFPESGALIPAANIVSNVEDLTSYVSAHLREGRGEESKILSSYSLREMHRAHWVQPDWNSGWGLGFGVRKRGDKTFVGHGGWVAGYKSQITFCVKDKIGVVVLLNCSDGDPAAFAYKIYDEVAPLLLKERPAEPEKAVDRSGWPALAGDYRDNWGWRARVMQLGGKLVFYEYSYPANESPSGGVTELIPLEQDRFRQKNNGELVRFERDADGRIVKLWKGENYWLPVKMH